MSSSDWRNSPEGIAWAQGPGAAAQAKAEKQARQHQQRRVSIEEWRQHPMQVDRDLLHAQQREQKQELLRTQQQQQKLQNQQHHQQTHHQQLQHAALVAEAAGARLELVPCAPSGGSVFGPPGKSKPPGVFHSPGGGLGVDLQVPLPA